MGRLPHHLFTAVAVEFFAGPIPEQVFQLIGIFQKDSGREIFDY